MDELVAGQALGLREEKARLTESLESRRLCVVVAEDVGLACAVLVVVRGAVLCRCASRMTPG